jgi:hypothetical protein
MHILTLLRDENVLAILLVNAYFAVLVPLSFASAFSTQRLSKRIGTIFNYQARASAFTMYCLWTAVIYGLLSLYHAEIAAREYVSGEVQYFFFLVHLSSGTRISEGILACHVAVVLSKTRVQWTLAMFVFPVVLSRSVNPFAHKVLAYYEAVVSPVRGPESGTLFWVSCSILENSLTVFVFLCLACVWYCFCLLGKFAVAAYRSPEMGKLFAAFFVLLACLLGFYILDAYKAVVWLVFLIVSYPVIAAFLSSLFDGTRLNAAELRGLYRDSLKSIPGLPGLLRGRSPPPP